MEAFILIFSTGHVKHVDSCKAETKNNKMKIKGFDKVGWLIHTYGSNFYTHWRLQSAVDKALQKANILGLRFSRFALNGWSGSFW